jgi:microcystin-dependent protein
MSEPFLGEIRMVGFNFAPAGWALCDGQVLAISSNTALFSLLGTYYGGNGTSTFALPDFRSRVPVHQGQGTGLSDYVIGEVTGVENATLLSTNMPIHSHSVNAVTTGGTQAGPTNNVPAVESTGTSLNYAPTPSNTTMAPTMIANAGGSVPFSILQPVLCVNFIIALSGIYPSRN